MLKDHLEQLVKAGHLKEFVVEFGKRGAGLNRFPPPLKVIEVIHATPRGTNATRGVLGGLTTSKEDEKPIGSHCLRRGGSEGNDLAAR